MDFNALTDNLMRTCVTCLGGEAFDHVSSNETNRVSVIFDRNHQMEDLIDSSISTFRPVLKAHVSDFPTPVEVGDRFVQVSTGDVYEVVDVRPDSGHGQRIVLHMEE